ncbi:RNA polymerase sigma-70 factor [Larkinella harenae]
MTDPPDIALWKRIKSGEEAAFADLFYQYYPVLCVYAQRLLDDSDQAKDVVQGVFVRLYEQRESILLVTSLKAYLYKAVQNACLNQIKQAHTYQSHQQHLLQLSPPADHTEPILQLELEQLIWQAVQRLPPQCGRIFQMNRFEGKKNNQIAQELGLSVRTVETQISKALTLLRESLADYLPVLLLLAPADFL